MPAAATTVAAAARDTSPLRLLGAMTACAVALIPVYLLLYAVGSGIGAAMTAVARNPAVNSADLSLSAVAVLLFAWISHTLARPVVAPVAAL